MAYSLTKILRILTDAETDRDSPYSEDVSQTLRDIAPRLLEIIFGDDILEAQLDGDPTDLTTTGSYMDVDTVTDGSLDRDDQFVGMYVRFTGGTIWTNNSYNRYKVTDFDVANSRFHFDESLYADGARDGDTFVILGHVHDGDATEPNGAAIDLKDLVNIAEGDPMTQDLADAITDPDSNRAATADKDNPFITVSDAAGPMTIVDDGTQVISDTSTFPASGKVSISSQVPANTQYAQLYLTLWQGTGGSMAFRDPDVGTYRKHIEAAYSSGDEISMTSWVKVNPTSLQVDRYNTSNSCNCYAEVRAYVL